MASLMRGVKIASIPLAQGVTTLSPAPPPPPPPRPPGPPILPIIGILLPILIAAPLLVAPPPPCVRPSARVPRIVRPAVPRAIATPLAQAVPPAPRILPSRQVLPYGGANLWMPFAGGVGVVLLGMVLRRV